MPRVKALLASFLDGLPRRPCARAQSLRVAQTRAQQSASGRNWAGLPSWTGYCERRYTRRSPRSSSTLDDRDLLRQSALGGSWPIPASRVGETRGAYLPIVVDTVTAEEGEKLVESLLTTPGVLGVDVVGIDFSLDEGGTRG